MISNYIRMYQMDTCITYIDKTFTIKWLPTLVNLVIKITDIYIYIKTSCNNLVT